MELRPLGKRHLYGKDFCLSELKSKHECQKKIRVAVVVEVLCACDFVVRDADRGIKRSTAETEY